MMVPNEEILVWMSRPKRGSNGMVLLHTTRAVVLWSSA